MSAAPRQRHVDAETVGRPAIHLRDEDREDVAEALADALVAALDQWEKRQT